MKGTLTEYSNGQLPPWVEECNKIEEEEKKRSIGYKIRNLLSSYKVSFLKLDDFKTAWNDPNTRGSLIFVMSGAVICFVIFFIFVVLG